MGLQIGQSSKQRGVLLACLLISKSGSIGGKANVPAFIEEIKQGKRKLFGYGHRTYKGTDPRVRPIKELVEDSGANADPLIEVAKEIERLASADDFFKSRGLHPNADFYGNFVFTAM